MSIRQEDLQALHRVLQAALSFEDVLHSPELKELRDFVTHFGGRIPEAPQKKAPEPAAAPEPESDPEEDGENYWKVAPGETAERTAGFVDPLKSVTNGGEPSEADEEKAMELKAAGTAAAEEGDLDTAIAKLTEALVLASHKAMYWALRAEYYLKQKKVLPAIHDASKALEFNSENARALRVRGRCYRHLHEWEKSAHDLNQAQMVDFSESIDELLKLVQPKANKRRDNRRKREHEEKERQERERQERLRKQREEEQRQEEEERARSAGAGGMPGMGGMGGMPGTGGMPGMGGMPGAGGMPPGLSEALQDPEILAALQDPAVGPKIMSAMQNPSQLLQLMGDPQAGPVIQKLMSKLMPGMGGMGGMPGMGGMGGMPGAGGMGGMPGGMGGMGGMPGADHATKKDDLD